MQPEALPEVKSRPVYQPVEKSERSKLHLFVVAGEMPAEMSEIFSSCEESECKLITVNDTSEAKQNIQNTLPSLPLSTTVYVAGSEAFIWFVYERLIAEGMMPEQVKLFTPPEKFRQVFCCHCYHVSDGITQSPAVCGGCERLLVVTDHFARKKGAYLGYQVNAEDPNDIPESEELN
ncbi:MAG: hypothetical protein JXR18_11625 [Neptuniibacter sp.]